MGRPWMERLGENLHPNMQICTHSSVDRFPIWSEQWVGRGQGLQCFPKLARGREEQQQPVMSSLPSLNPLLGGW